MLCEPSIELGSLRVGHGYVLIFKALPEVLDQIEPLARREPSQLGREIAHVLQDGERGSSIRLNSVQPATTLDGSSRNAGRH